MTEQEIIDKVTALTIGKKIRDVVVPIREFPVWKRWANALLPRRYRFKPYKIFEVYESVSGNAFRIANVAMGLPEEILGNTMYEISLPLIHKHHKDIVYVVATGITNSKAEPPSSLIDLLAWNLPYDELYEILNAILDGAGMQAFINSTILIKGTDSILKPRIDPIDGSE